MKFKILTERLLKKPEINENKRVFGSILIALSGLLLYLDKVLLFLNIEGTNDYGFANFDTFIWVLMQSVSPLIMIFGFQLKPYFTSFLVPIYCYTIHIIWVFQPQMKIDNVLLHVYALGSCILFILLLFLIQKISLWRKQQDTLKNEFQQETKEILNILKSKTLSES